MLILVEELVLIFKYEQAFFSHFTLFTRISSADMMKMT